MLPQARQIDELKRGFMGRFENDVRRISSLEGFLPTGRAKAPLIARLQTRKSVFRARRLQVVPAIFREFEKSFGHPGTHDMDAVITGTRTTASVAIPTGQRIE